MMMMSTTSLCAHSGGRFMDELGLPCWVSQRLSFSKCLDMFLGISHGFLLKQHERHEKKTKRLNSLNAEKTLVKGGSRYDYIFLPIVQPGQEWGSAAPGR